MADINYEKKNEALVLFHLSNSALSIKAFDWHRSFISFNDANTIYHFNSKLVCFGYLGIKLAFKGII